MFNPEVLDEPQQGSPRKDGKKLSMEKRDTTKYVLKDKNEVVYVGITNDLERRTQEHKAEGMKFTSVTKVGNNTTREGASNWETVRIQTYMQNHNGATPKYNKNDNGK